jgi:hypothetical protein
MPEALPEADRARWEGLTAAQRRRAVTRISAIERWNGDSIPIDLAEQESGLSRSRFYRMAADWRAAPSLSALGISVGTVGARTRLDPDAVNALQAIVSDVVAMNAGASVSQLVQLMVQRAGVPAEALPGTSKLRAIVEDEQRRVAATGEAGNVVRFDCSAINLPRNDGRPWILFGALDEGTRLILGAAVLAEADAAAGYRAAAQDARERLERIRDALPWAIRTARIEMTAGADLEASADLVRGLAAAGVRVRPQLASVPRRFGRYFRAVVGTRMGRVEITPLRTLEGTALPDNGDMTPWTQGEATVAVRTAVDQHNEALLAELAGRGVGRMPDDLSLVLEHLAEV